MKTIIRYGAWLFPLAVFACKSDETKATPGPSTDGGTFTFNPGATADASLPADSGANGPTTLDAGTMDAGGMDAGGMDGGGMDAANGDGGSGSSSGDGSAEGGSQPAPDGSADGGSGNGDASTAAKDLVDTAVANGSFTTLVSAIQTAGLESTLRGAGPFTVFAPTDAAFDKVPSFLGDQLVTPPYKTELALILKYHVLSAAVTAADVLGKTQSVDTVAGAKVSVDGSNNKVVLNGSVTVTTPDVTASNGVIHVVDGVLFPTIVDTAVGYDDGTNTFSTLVTAVTAAGLVDTLNGAGPFTVFAPTDAAFAALKASLGDAAFDAILADKAKLTKILTYHVVAASAPVYAKDVTTGEVATVETGKIKLTASGGAVTVGDSTTTAAKVVLPDLPARNGVIHVIDKVLLPAGL